MTWRPGSSSRRTCGLVSLTGSLFTLTGGTHPDFGLHVPGGQYCRAHLCICSCPSVLIPFPEKIVGGLQVLVGQPGTVTLAGAHVHPGDVRVRLSGFPENRAWLGLFTLPLPLMPATEEKVTTGTGSLTAAPPGAF